MSLVLSLLSFNYNIEDSAIVHQMYVHVTMKLCRHHALNTYALSKLDRLSLKHRYNISRQAQLIAMVLRHLETNTELLEVFELHLYVR